jgi:hypothetical protein
LRLGSFSEAMVFFKANDCLLYMTGNLLTAKEREHLGIHSISVSYDDVSHSVEGNNHTAD